MNPYVQIINTSKYTHIYAHAHLHAHVCMVHTYKHTHVHTHTMYHTHTHTDTHIHVFTIAGYYIYTMKHRRRSTLQYDISSRRCKLSFMIHHALGVTLQRNLLMPFFLLVVFRHVLGPIIPNAN